MKLIVAFIAFFFVLTLGLIAETPVKESPERRFARLQYDAAVEMRDELRAKIEPVLAEVERLKSQINASDYSTAGLEKRSYKSAQIVAILEGIAPLVSQHDDIQITIVTLLRPRLETADDCVATYRSTIDKKVSDLTTRETEMVQRCRSLNLYPPEKSPEPPEQSPQLPQAEKKL